MSREIRFGPPGHPVEPDGVVSRPGGIPAPPPKPSVIGSTAVPDRLVKLMSVGRQSPSPQAERSAPLLPGQFLPGGHDTGSVVENRVGVVYRLPVRTIVVPVRGAEGLLW
ncbi:hypothetical protein GCM10010415_24090 [Streptomyces atrovirens]